MVALSVIVTAGVRSKTVRMCLEWLCHQTQPAPDFEVIIAAVGPSETTHAALATLVTPFELRVVQQATCRASACNRAVDAAVGRYCLFLGDDTVADPTLVAAHLRARRECPAMVGLGRFMLMPAARADGFGRYHVQRWNERQAALAEGEQPTFLDCSGSNMSVSRAAFLRAGGFAVDLPHGYERELAYRLVRQGEPLVYIPDAVVRKDERASFSALATEVKRMGAADVALYRRHPSTLSHLDLGRFADADPCQRHRVTLLRRVLLAVDAPLGPFALADWWRRSRADEWYRFLWGYCYWRGVRHAVADRDTWRRLTRSPIILMYHAFGAPQEPPSCYVIPGRHFARHLAWLRWMHYHVLDLEEFLRHRREHSLPPARSVIITIDDGYADNRTVAYPILRRYNVPATIFPVSAYVGDRNRWDSTGELAGRPLLSWPQMREMLHGNVRFGAHTRRHIPLTTLAPHEARKEIEGSRRDLERALDRPILSFSYPHGRFDEVSEAAVERAGFLGACGSRNGVNEPVVPLYALRRLEVRGADSFAHFAVSVWLGRSGIIARSWPRRTVPMMRETAAIGGRTAEVAPQVERRGGVS